jgi:hypothetical protein
MLYQLTNQGCKIECRDMRTRDVKTLSELVQCGLVHPVKREVCYSLGERSYDKWISMKSNYKECGIAFVL